MPLFANTIEALTGLELQHIEGIIEDRTPDGTWERLTIYWLSRLAEHFGYAVDVAEQRDGDGDCYPRVTWTVLDRGGGTIAQFWAIDCVCGDHGLRNGRWLDVEHADAHLEADF